MKPKVDYYHEADILIIGGGIAGCFAAIKASEAGARNIIQMDKGQIGMSGCSAFAAGVYTAFCPQEDDYDEVFKELIVEPAPFIVDQERLQVHLKMVWDTVIEMEHYGVEIEKTADGKIERYAGRGAVKNVMFHGPQMMAVLAKQARKRKVKQINKTYMTDLLTKNGRVVGAIAFNIETGKCHVFTAKAVILATGSNFYKGRCPGHRNVTGDGHVAAYRAGAELTGLDFALHNAFPARYDIGPGMHMYVGLGAKFVNAKGEPFMQKYEPILKDRALLGPLSAAFAMEIKQGHGPIYLDMTHFTKDQVQKLKRVIPLPMLMYAKAGLEVNDRFLDKIEWMVYAPTSRGGLTTNRKFETSLPGLYACGDATGWMGAEGGAAALPGGATSGILAGKSAAAFAAQTDMSPIDKEQISYLLEQAFQPMKRSSGVEPDHVLIGVQEAVFPYGVFLLRDESRLQNALNEIEYIRDNLVPRLHAYDPHYLRMSLEAQNIVTYAEMQLRSALLRKESRGGTCLREDYPLQDNQRWLKWISLQQQDDRMSLYTRELPFDQYPVKPPADKYLDPLWQRAKELGMITIKEGHVLWA